MLSIIPGHASIANQVFAKFISRLPHKRSEPPHPHTPKPERMKAALFALAKIMGDESIANRDPLSSLSFCCLSTDVVNSQMDTLAQFRKRLKNAFSPLGPDGRPLRRYIYPRLCHCWFQTSICSRYSDRQTSHWFHGEKNGLSIAGKPLPNLVLPYHIIQYLGLLARETFSSVRTWQWIDRQTFGPGPHCGWSTTSCRLHWSSRETYHQRFDG
jgi:hypothetical protein